MPPTTTTKAKNASTQSSGNNAENIPAKGITKVSKADLANSGSIKTTVKQQISSKSSKSSGSGSSNTSGSSNGHRNSVDPNPGSDSSIRRLSVDSWQPKAETNKINKNRTMVSRGSSNEDPGRGSSETTNPSIKPEESNPRPQDLAYTGMPTDATKAFQQGLPKTEPQKGPAYKPQIGNESRVLTGHDRNVTPATSPTKRQHQAQIRSERTIPQPQTIQGQHESFGMKQRGSGSSENTWGMKAASYDIAQETQAKATNTDENKRVYKVDEVAPQSSAIAPTLKTMAKLNRSIGLGNKVNAIINTDSQLGLDDCRVGAELLWAQFTANPSGSFAEYFIEECEKRVEEDETFSYDYQQLIANKAYCQTILKEVFHGQPVGWTKHPGTTEASYRCMNLYVSTTGQAIYIHPLAAGLANDDADGDKAEVEFERPKAQMLGRPTDYLLNPVSRRWDINWDIWNQVYWGDNVSDTRARLELILEHANIDVVGKDQSLLLDRISQCLFDASSRRSADDPRIDHSMDLLLTTIAHMANNHNFVHANDQEIYRDRAEAVSDVICAIWEHNTTINADTQKLYPVLENSYLRFWDAPDGAQPLMHTVYRQATVPYNYHDMATSLFLGLGSGGGTNLPWRQAAATVLQSRRKSDRRATELVPNIKYAHISAPTAQYYYSLAANLLLDEDDAKITSKSFVNGHVFREIDRPPRMLTDAEMARLNEKYHGKNDRRRGHRATKNRRGGQDDPAVIEAKKIFERHWDDWCVKFAKSYNYWTTILDESGWIADTEGKYHQAQSYKDKLIPIETYSPRTGADYARIERGQGYSRFINAFRDVYSDFTMGTLFDVSTVQEMLSDNIYANGLSVLPSNWQNMTLVEFIRNSDFISGEQDTSRSAYEYFFHRLMNSRKYLADAMWRNLHDFFKKFAGKENLTWKEGFDLLLELSPKVCFSLGITAANAKLNPMVAAMTDKNHASADDKMSCYYSLLVAYKMQEVFRAEIAEDRDWALRELQKLSDCSNLWRALVNDYLNNGDAIAVLLDTDVSLEEKEQLCQKIVRQQHIQYSFQLSETAYQLADDTRGPVGVSSFPGDTKEIQQSARKIADRYDSSDTAMLTQVRDLQSYVKDHPGSWMNFLRDLKSGKRSTANINSFHHADVIGEAENPTNDVKDKAHNQPATQNFYAAVANANGGMWSDWQIINGFFNGTITKENLQKNPGIIARFIYDPDFELTVVDGTKQAKVNWETLLYLSEYNQAYYPWGINYEVSEDAWMHLFAEFPKIAMAFRQTTVQPRSNEDTGLTEQTKSRVAAQGTIRDAVEYSNPTNTLITHLSRYPGFTAMASLSTNITSKTSAQTRDDMAKGVTNLAQQIRWLAKLAKEEKRAPADVARWFFNGVEKELTVQYGSTDDRTILYHISDQTLQPDDVVAYVDGVASETSSKLIGDMTQFIEDTLQYNLECSDRQYAQGVEPCEFNWESEENISLYYATNSALSSSKVGYSIPINGKAGDDYRGLSIVANRRTVDDCGNHETRLVPIYELFDGSYDGSQLEDGTVIDSYTVEDLLLKFGSWTVAVPVESPEFCTEPLGCEHHHPKASSALNRQNDGATPLGRLLEWIRDDSTEGHGLQLKRTGLGFLVDPNPRDALSSKRSIEFRNTVQGAFNSDGLPGAYRAAGQELMSFYSELDYKEFTLNDWIDIAHYIVHENSNGDCVLISLAQLGNIANQAIAKLKYEQGKNNTDIDQKYQAIIDDLNEVIESVTVTNPNTIEIDEEHQLDVEDIFNNIRVNGTTRVGWQGVSAFGSFPDANASTLRYFLEGDPNLENSQYTSANPYSHQPRLDYKVQQYEQELGDEFFAYSTDRDALPKEIQDQYYLDYAKDEYGQGIPGTSEERSVWVNNKQEKRWYSRTGHFRQYIDETENLCGIATILDDTDVDEVTNEYVQIHNGMRLVIVPKPGSRNIVIFDTNYLYDQLSSADFKQLLTDTANVCRDMGMTLRIPLEPPTIGRDRHLIEKEKKHIAECKETVLNVLNSLGDWGAAGVVRPGGHALKPGKPALGWKNKQADIESVEWLNLDFFEIQMNHPQALKGDPEEFIGGTYTLSDDDVDVLALVPDNTPLAKGDADIAITEQGADHIGSIPREGQISFRPESMFVACRPMFGSFETTTIDTTVNDTDEIQEIIDKWLDNSDDIAFDTTMNANELSMRMEQFIYRFRNNSFDEELGLISKDISQDEIIGFARCYQDGYVVYHPLQFETDTNGKGTKTSLPMHCEITHVSTNYNGYLTIDWYSEESLDGQAIKLQQGDYPVNKGTGVVDRSISAHLASGDEVHFLAAAFNFIPRAGQNNIYQDMSSFMAVRRRYKGGYNAALDIDGFLPEEKDRFRKSAIAHGILTMSDWRIWLEQDINWFGEDEAELNVWLTQTCQRLVKRGINPTDFLASNFGDGTNRIRSFNWYDWTYGFSKMQTLESYMDNMLKFFHKIDPTFCPNGRNDTTNPDNYLFDVNFMMRVIMTINNKTVAPRCHLRVGPHIITDYSGNTAGATYSQHDTDALRAAVALATRNATGKEANKLADIIADRIASNYIVTKAYGAPAIKIGE